MATRLQVRRDTAAQWTSVNPILADGEIGYERDTGKIKVGNGATAWNSLGYVVYTGAGGEIQALDFKATGITGATAGARFVGATTTGAPTTGTFVVGDFVIAQNGHILVCTTAGTPGTWTDVGASSAVVSFNTRTGAVTLTLGDVTGVGGADDSAVVHKTGTETVAGAKTFSSEVIALDFKPSGLPGATQATRLVGANATGAPTSGTFVVGDFAIARDGHLWICTSAGTPGTWVDAGTYGSGVTGVASFNTRTGAVTLTLGDVTGAGGADDSAVVHKTGTETVAGAKTFSSEVIAPDFKPSGLTGATTATRYVGGTTTGAPTSGTFLLGDFVIAQDGHMWVCTTAGTPGTWTDAGSFGGGGGSGSAVDTETLFWMTRLA